ncbi:MAG: Dabb family protein [Phycisphaerae bacterium]
MFVHCVHFWLKPELSAEEREAFLAGLRDIENSPNVTSVRVGTPAGTPRPVVDNSYDYQLLVHFADQAAHDAYQAPGDAVHQHFVDTFKTYWTKVLIYDSLDA